MRRVFWIALLLASTAGPVRAEPSASLFFFSPDFSPGNLSVLKQAAEAYLREAGLDARFQAFVRFEDFQREFRSQRPLFVVVPEWASTAACLGAQARPIARPVRGGETSGRKALVAPLAVKSVRAIASGSVAATVPAGGGPTGSGLERLRRENPRIRIIPVPKDIDALLAVAFGQVDAAYVSTRQFAMFAAANPKLGSGLREIGYAQPMPFPMIYAGADTNADDVEKMRAAANNVSQSGTGKRLMALLGYDGWMLVESSEGPAGREEKTAANACDVGGGGAR